MTHEKRQEWMKAWLSNQKGQNQLLQALIEDNDSLHEEIKRMASVNETLLEQVKGYQTAADREAEEYARKSKEQAEKIVQLEQSLKESESH